MSRLIASFFVFLVLTICLTYADGQRETTVPSLTIYTYDSFISEWGPGPSIKRLFEEETGTRLEFVSAGDAGQILSRLIFEKDAPQADVVIGLDNNLLERTLAEEVLIPYVSPVLEKIPYFLHFDETYHLVPYDYGYFAVIYDSEKLSTVPTSMANLTLPRYQDSLILMDPRTSTPGLGFLHWTISVYADTWQEYWRQLDSSILTITEGWDAGYGLFTQGEAPMVLSYTTSPAYHVEYEDTTRYRAAEFKEGHPIQIEGVGIVKGTRKIDEARLFIDKLLSKAYQAIIPLTNWMFPVNPSVELPSSFEYALKPDKTIPHDKQTLYKSDEELIQAWIQVITER